LLGGGCEGVAITAAWGGFFLHMVCFFLDGFSRESDQRTWIFLSGKRKRSVLLLVKLVTTYKKWKWEREIKLGFIF
jgi:hypothetical protein